MQCCVMYFHAIRIDVRGWSGTSPELQHSVTAPHIQPAHTLTSAVKGLHGCIFSTQCLARDTAGRTSRPPCS